MSPVLPALIVQLFSSLASILDLQVSHPQLGGEGKGTIVQAPSAVSNSLMAFC